MIYKIDKFINADPLLNWNYIFMSLSVKQFSKVYKDLDFPFIPPDNLRQLAHDFVVARQIILNKPVSETINVDLLVSTLAEDSYTKKRRKLFENMFLHLEEAGYAEKIYMWGKRTHYYFKNDSVDALNATTSILREWAIIEYLKLPLLTNHKFYSSDWNGLVANLSSNYAEGNSTQLVPIPLPPTACINLLAIILRHEMQRLRFRNALDDIDTSPKSEWEQFVLARWAWIANEGRFRINLHEWNMIIAALSDKEITLLEQWALQHKDHYHGLRFPLPDFQQKDGNPLQNTF